MSIDRMRMWSDDWSQAEAALERDEREAAEAHDLVDENDFAGELEEAWQAEEAYRRDEEEKREAAWAEEVAFNEYYERGGQGMADDVWNRIRRV